MAPGSGDGGADRDPNPDAQQNAVLRVAQRNADPAPEGDGFDECPARRPPLLVTSAQPCCLLGPDAPELLVARSLSVSSRRVAIGLASVLVVVSLLSVGSTAWNAMSSDYDQYIERLRLQVPHGATVEADPLVWFGFADHPFMATHYFALTDSYEDEVRRLGIDYVIPDLPTLGSCPSCPYSTEVREFLEYNAELVAVVEDPLYGSFVADDGDGFKSPVYRIDD